MRDDGNILWLLITLFAPLSLLAIGGWASVLAPMHHQVVEIHQWMSQRQFVDIFAITRAAPGPGAMIVTLIGWKIAGWWGAIVASLAIFIPSSLLCYSVGHVWNRYRGASWHTALELGLTPVGVGLLMAGSMSVMFATSSGIGGWAIAFAAAVAFILWSKVHPLLILLAGGLISVVIARIF
jgi:chromate transporter